MHSKVKPTVFRGATLCCTAEQNFEVYKQLKKIVFQVQKKIKYSLLLRNDRILLLDKNKRAAIIF